MKKISVMIILLLASGMLVAQWRQTAGPEGGVINAFVNRGTVWYAGTSSGIYFSPDGMQSWVRVNTGLTDVPVLSMLFSDTLVLAGTYGKGIFRSGDDGISWQESNTGLENLTIRSLAIKGNTLFAGTEAGLYFSTDSGLSWQMEAEILKSRKIFLLFVSDTVVYAGTQDGGFFVSHDGGHGWTTVSEGLPSCDILTIIHHGSNLFLGTRGYGLYLLTGNTWIPAGNGIPPSATMKSLGGSSGVLLAGTYGDGIFRSTDDGENWTPVNTYIYNPLINVVDVDGGAFYAGSDGGGIFHSDNNGQSWFPANSGVVGTDNQSVVISGNNIFSGTFGAGVSSSTDNGYTWNTMNIGLLNWYVTSLVFFGSNLMAATRGGGFFITGSEGSTWVARNNGLSNPYLTSLLSHDSLIFAGSWGGGVFRSDDTARSWSAINEGLTALQVKCLASFGQKIVAGTWGDGLFVSSDKGISWIHVGSLSSDNINCLMVMGSRLFAGTTKGLYLSEDGGLTWIMTGGDLPQTAIESLQFYREVLFCATEGEGVFISYDHGEHWNALNDGLGDPFVNSLSGNNRNLFAGTGNNGVWRIAYSDIFTITVDPDSVLLEKEMGNLDTLFITTPVDWSLGGMIPEWLSVNKTSGSGNDKLVFESLQPNLADHSRETMLYLFSQAANPVSFKVVQKGKTTSVNEQVEGTICLVPNPSDGLIEIKADFTMDSYRVSDISGREVREHKVGSGSFILDLRDREPGVYLVEILARGSKITRKILIY